MATNLKILRRYLYRQNLYRYFYTELYYSLCEIIIFHFIRRLVAVWSYKEVRHYCCHLIDTGVLCVEGDT